MDTIPRNIVAVLLGFIVGSLVDMAIITVSPHIIPPSSMSRRSRA